MVEQGRGDGERTRPSGAIFAMLGPAGALHKQFLSDIWKTLKSFCVGNLWVVCKTLSDSRFILVPSPALNVGRNYSVFHSQSPQEVRHCALYLVGVLVSDGFPSQGRSSSQS